MRGNAAVLSKARDYLAEHGALAFSIITGPANRKLAEGVAPPLLFRGLCYHGATPQTTAQTASRHFIGVDDGIRTRDLQGHNLHLRRLRPNALERLLTRNLQ